MSTSVVARAAGAGAAATAVGAPLAAAAARRLHVLARRWVILVPGGVVVHDPLALREPVLMPRSSITTVAPALEAATGERYELRELFTY